MRKVRESAEGTNSAPGYLVKVLHRLAKVGILSGQRGSQGGFTLKREPKVLTVLDVINAIDPIERLCDCPVGLDSDGKNLCPLHRRIDDAMALIEESFAGVTIAQLIEQSSQAKPLCNALSDTAILPSRD